MNFKAVIEKYHLKFIFLFLLLSVLYYGSIMDKMPLNSHVWRQTDCLSLTQKYYEGASFLKPEMHVYLGKDFRNAKSAGEFPILYYTVAQLWKVFGVSYFVFRFFYFLILAAGIFLFYRSIDLVFKSRFWAIMLSLLLYTSPVLVNYGVSFLTDGPAFSFNLIALYFLTRFAIHEKKKFFYWAMFFFALAGLLKVSALILFIFFGFIFILERFGAKSLGSKKLFPDWKLVFGFAAVLVSIVSWFIYAYFYNEASGFKYTFNDIHPFWLMKAGEPSTVFNGVKYYTSHVLYSRPMIFLIIFLLVYNLTLRKKIPLLAYLANIVISTGVFIYFALWAPLMGVHDYYFVSVLVIFFATIVPFAYYLNTNFTRVEESKALRNTIYIFFAINFVICLDAIKLKTISKRGNHLISDKTFVGTMKYFNNEEHYKWTNYVNLKEKLPLLGINKSDKLICMSDLTFNASLFFLNHNGWTNFSKYDKETQIQKLVTSGAKYLIVEESDLNKMPFLKSFTAVQLGHYRNILIFKL
ncbi:MAG: ArnT family glycosyltransferase [Flavobacteriia bacterium]|jgi:hypothetical protein